MSPIPPVAGLAIDESACDDRRRRRPRCCAVVEVSHSREGTCFARGFDAETQNPAEMQRAGWQANLDSFGRYVQAKG